MTQFFPDSPRRIVVHCTATREGAWYDAGDIDRWHRERGWSGIGYHQVVLLDGTTEHGRPEREIGAHVAGHNHDSLAVVYVGGLAADGRTPKDTRTPMQRLRLLSVVRRWMEVHGIQASKVFGHYELDGKKACPSFDMQAFRAELSSATTAPVAPTEARFVASDLPVIRTEEAEASHHRIKRLQTMLGLTADGVIGPHTYLAIADALANEVKP